MNFKDFYLIEILGSKKNLLLAPDIHKITHFTSSLIIEQCEQAGFFIYGNIYINADKLNFITSEIIQFDALVIYKHSFTGLPNNFINDKNIIFIKGQIANFNGDSIILCEQIPNTFIKVNDIFVNPNKILAWNKCELKSIYHKKICTCSLTIDLLPYINNYIRKIALYLLLLNKTYKFGKFIVLMIINYIN